MKKPTFMKSNYAIIVLWIVSFFVVLSFFIYIFIAFNGDNKTSKSISVTTFSCSYNDTLKPIDEKISTLLSYEKYKKLNDSINDVRSLENGSLIEAVFSPFNGVISMKFLKEKDVIHKKVFDLFSIKAPESYFYIMKGWKIKTNEHSSFGDNTYYVKNGVPYLRKYVLISNKGKHSNWVMKEYKLNYFCYKADKEILIPISKNAYPLAKFTSIFIMLIFVIVYLVCAFMAFKILHNISKGKVFIEENINMLRQASFITILTPLLCTLITLSQRLIFYNYFDDNIVIDVEIFKSYISLLFCGLAVSILYSVFKRGFNIQQENDLVV